jgi:hypothetical protein
MSLNNARRFVEKMREDQSFRNKALQTTGQEDLSSVLWPWLNAWLSWKCRHAAELCKPCKRLRIGCRMRQKTCSL